jgi:hypothetical protein
VVLKPGHPAVITGLLCKSPSALVRTGGAGGDSNSVPLVTVNEEGVKLGVTVALTDGDVIWVCGSRHRYAVEFPGTVASGSGTGGSGGGGGKGTKRVGGGDDDASSAPNAKRRQPQEKPVLVVLPGATSNLAGDMIQHLIPLLEAKFDVRIRRGSSEKEQGGSRWKGWNPSSNALTVVNTLGICPLEADSAPWYVLGCSFGNRVACSIVSDELTKVAPSLILTG